MISKSRDNQKETSCKRCGSRNSLPLNSIFARLAFSFYLWLNFYFFTGSFTLASLLAWVPLFLPYARRCADCNLKRYELPEFSERNFWVGHHADTYLLAIAPVILVITFLINNFPHTGLERIAYLPSIYVLSGLLIIGYILGFPHHRGEKRALIWTIITVINVVLAVWMYPQEHGAVRFY